jgi:mycothiol synthase
MTLRLLKPRDRTAVIAMRNEDLPPHQHGTLSEWDSWEAIEPPDKVSRRFVVGDPPIAYLSVIDMNTTLMRHPGDCAFGLMVARTCRRQGLGALLYAEVLAFAEERGLRRLVTSFTEHGPEEPALAFLGSRGFVEMDREQPSSLDLTTFDPHHFADALARAEAQGVRLLSYADVPDTEANRRRLYDLNLSIDRDMPTHDDVPFEDPPFDDWVRFFLHPEFDPAALILAELDGDWIGLTQLGFRQETSIGSTWTTGVLAPYRDRGLALALKVHSLTAAKSRGCPVVTTENHEDNAPMLAINRRLGFVPDPPQVRFQKPLRAE